MSRLAEVRAGSASTPRNYRKRNWSGSRASSREDNAVDIGGVFETKRRRDAGRRYWKTSRARRVGGAHGGDGLGRMFRIARAFACYGKKSERPHGCDTGHWKCRELLSAVFA